MKERLKERKEDSSEAVQSLLLSNRPFIVMSYFVKQPASYSVQLKQNNTKNFSLTFYLLLLLLLLLFVFFVFISKRLTSWRFQAMKRSGRDISCVTTNG
jgi:hypothetical protein